MGYILCDQIIMVAVFLSLQTENSYIGDDAGKKPGEKVLPYFEEK